MDAPFFRHLIQQRLQALVSDQSSAEETKASVELDQTRVGRLSRMDAMQVHQMEQALNRRRQKEILALKSALKRIDDGEYGFCVQCDEPINPKRLEIDPTASLCIPCAQVNESNLRGS